MMPLGLRLRRRREQGVGNLVIAAFRVASQTIRGAIEETLAGTPRVSAASTEPSNLADDAGTALEVVPLRDLWDEAYEALRGTHSKLVEQYEESVMRINQDNTHLAPNGSLARQEQLSAFITKRLDSIEKDQTGFTMAGRKVVLHERFDKFIRIVMFAKDFVSSAVNGEPHAALAWAGVCVLLPVSIEKFPGLLFISEIFHPLKTVNIWSVSQGSST